MRWLLALARDRAYGVHLEGQNAIDHLNYRCFVASQGCCGQNISRV